MDQVLDLPGVLIGRDSELDRLRRFAASAGDEHGKTVTITAEAGTGKSALVDALARDLAGFRVLTCRGVETELGLPFSGLHTLVHPVLPFLDRLDAEHQRTLQAALSMTDPSPASPVQVATAALQLMAAASAEQPLLVIVDDLHWIDEETMGVLAFLARRLEHDRCLLLATLRPHSGAEPLPGEVLLLEALGAADVRTLAERLLQRPLTDEVAAALHAATGGNPLAVIETLQYARDDLDALGSMLDDPIPASDRIVRGFSSRLEALPASTRTALLVVACSISEDAAEIEAGLEQLGLSADALADAEGAGVLQRHRGKVSLAHPLLRSTVLQTSSADDRRRSHAGLAAVAVRPGARCWHAAWATDSADESIAAALEEAASDFRARGGGVAAARALERAAELSETREERARRLFDAGVAARGAARDSWALRLFEDALDATSDPALQVSIELERLIVETQTASNEQALASHLALARQYDDVDEDVAESCWSDVVTEGILAGDMRTALEAVDRLGALPGERTAAGKAVMLTAELLSGRDSRGAAAQLDAVAKASPLGHRASLIEALAWTEQFAAARQRLEDSLDETRRAANDVAELSLMLADGYLRFRTGEWERSRRQLIHGMRVARVGAQAYWGTMLAATLASVLAAEGDPEAVERAAEAQRMSDELGLSTVTPYVESALGLFHLSHAAPAAALPHLERAEDWSARAGYVEPGLWSSPSDLVDAYLGTGRRTEAAAALERLRHRATVTGRRCALAAVARLDGTLAADGEFDGPFRQALTLLDDADAPFELARAQLAYGRRLEAAGRSEAASVLAAASAGFRQLGATAWVRQVEGVGREASSLAEDQAETAAFGQLTARERVVADCIAQGMSNKEAAAHLFLTPKTIEWHLRQVYQKLGIRSRTQLVALMSGTLVARAGSAAPTA